MAICQSSQLQLHKSNDVEVNHTRRDSLSQRCEDDSELATKLRFRVLIFPPGHDRHTGRMS